MRPRTDRGVGVVEAVGVGKQDEQFRIGNLGDIRSKVVVVAELNFLSGNRVVLVDDGDDAIVNKRVDGVVGVRIAWFTGDAVLREEDLGDGDARFWKSFSY